MSGPYTRCSRGGGSLEPQALRSTTLGSRLRGSTVVLGMALALTACATQVSSAVSTTATAPGFLLGLWHGFIFPVAWVLSLFMPEVAVYAVPNNGGWYDFGYFLGIVVFGVGARKTRTVYVTRRVRG
jgi:hypothetical protein